MRQNPVKARLVEKAEEYPWSSATGQFVMDVSDFDRLQGRRDVAAKAATHKP
jgi:hypothetical protein